MSVQVVFHELASREARAAEAWYALRSRDTAAAFRAAVDAAAQRISDDIATHAIGSTRFRYVYVRRFPYRLIYCLTTPATARVVAVAHTRRRQGYWRRRT